MKNFLKYALGSLLLAFMAVGCTKENTPERKNIQHPGDQEEIHRDNAYYERLRAYKKTKHKIAFGWYGTWTAMGPSYQSRISNCPDSLDIISMWSQWHSLDKNQKADKDFVQKIKGTKVTFTIFSDKMPEPFLTEIGGGEYTDEAIAAYAKAYAKDSMEKYNYDGIDIDYEPGYGASGPFVGYDNELFRKLILEMGKYVGPKSGTGKLFLIDGVPYAVHTDLAEYFVYGIGLAYQSRGYTDLQSRFTQAYKKGWKPEQYIFAENFESYWETGGVNHLTRDGQTVPSLLGMALFNPDEGEGAGFGAYHMEYEYAHSDMPYKYMRKAIQLVNPAPVGDYTKNLVRLNETGTSNFELSQIPSGVLYGEVNYSLTGRLGIPAAADVDIQLTVDNSVIDAYNNDNGTECVAIDPAQVTFSGALHFAAGERTTATAVKVAVNGLKELAEGEYLIPIRPAPEATSGYGIDEASYLKYLMITKKMTTIQVTVKGAADVAEHTIMTLLDGGFDGTVSENLSVVLSMGAVSDIEIGFKADNDLVETYNKKNNTTYHLLNTDDIVISGTMTVAEGKTASTGTLNVSFTNFEALEDGYSMIAVYPDLTSLGDYSADAKLGVKYILIQKLAQNLASEQNLDPFEDDCVLIDNTKNELEWIFSCENQNKSIGGTGVWNDNYIGAMFDGVTNIGWYCIWDNYYSWKRSYGGLVTLDMKKAQTVSTLRWTYYKSAFKTIKEVSVSENGTDWVPQNSGNVTVANGNPQWITFANPVKARYIRLVFTDGYSSQSGMSEVDVWAPKAQ